MSGIWLFIKCNGLHGTHMLSPSLRPKSKKGFRYSLAKAIRSGYYRFVFGRHFPFGTLLSRSFHSLESRLVKGDVPLPKETWELQYGSGKWTYMKNLDELSRYALIAGYFNSLKPKGSLLDVGCGEGILQELIGPFNYSRYVGIDLSEVAIRQASIKQDDKTIFIFEDASVYTPEGKFDAVVFNEILYYFNTPSEVVRRYLPCLKEGGILITSLYSNSARATSIWRRLKSDYHSLDEVKVTNGSKSWVVNAFTCYPE